jgi:sigma-E factor negative regulatory protein RseC
MKTVEEGIVIDLDGGLAKVKATRHGDCKNCGACPGDNATVLTVRNLLEALPGQRVAFEMQQNNMLIIAFVVYILPLMAIFLGAGLGYLGAIKMGLPIVPIQILGGLLLFIISILAIKRLDQSTSKEVSKLPNIIKIM